ncbi:MAG: hypothetical protein J6B44_01795 [Muribaculaceae bacterium]|nr:hypothetical protein [Muribaculaceae bacterium]
MFKRKFLLPVLLMSSFLSIMLNSCGSASLVVSQGVDLSEYKYICFGDKGIEGEDSFADIIMMVENEIVYTNLKPISLAHAPDDCWWHTLTPDIYITAEKLGGGNTHITLSLRDINTGQDVIVIKSSGFGWTSSHDKKLAVKALGKKLQSVFGSKE